MKTNLLLLAGLLAVTGCASRYVIKTNSGSQITTQSKPRLKNGVYTYKDAMGRSTFIPAGSVAQISPASVEQEEDKSSKFRPATQR